MSETVPVQPRKQAHTLVQCVRCPQRFRWWFRRPQPALCPDCRFSVSAVERRTIWEAA